MRSSERMCVSFANDCVMVSGPVCHTRHLLCIYIYVSVCIVCDVLVCAMLYGACFWLCCLCCVCVRVLFCVFVCLFVMYCVLF